MTLLGGFAQVSGLTFLSRVFGLARDIVVAAVFGAGPVADAFFAAFRLPNTLRRFTAEGALTQAFIPAYTGALQTDTAAADKIGRDKHTLHCANAHRQPQYRKIAPPDAPKLCPPIANR